jgi:Antitoxin VbhA
MDETKTPDEFAKINVEEAERRRTHVRTAIADSRIEGMIPPDRAELEIFAAYIRGEIEAGDLVNAYKDGMT